MDILHEDQYTFMILSRSVLLIIRNAADKSCRENQNTYFMFNNFFFSKIVPFTTYVEKHGNAREDIYDNIALGNCMLDT